MQNTKPLSSPSASTSRAEVFPTLPLASATAKKITFGRPLTISIAKLIFVRFPLQCKRKAFPDDPADAIHNEHAAAHVERGGYSKVPISDFDFVSLYENHVHYLVIECH